MAIGPKLKWVKSNIDDKIYLILLFIISVLLTLIIVKNLNLEFLSNTILIAFSFYLFFITLRDFLTNKYKNFSQNLAHFGFSLLILSIIFNNIFATEVITNLKVGETFESKKFKINFETLVKKDNQNYESFVGKLIIENSKGSIEVMRPELRIYNQPNISTSEADIKTSFFADKFITMNIVQNQDYFNIRYQIKPFMIWIWFSVLLITLGGLLSLFKKRYEK